MKKLVYFEEGNAGDYLAQNMRIAKSHEQAEYELILRDRDDLFTSGGQVVLEREGRQYTQQNYMTSFAGVSFVEHTSDPEKEVIKLKLQKIKTNHDGSGC